MPAIPRRSPPPNAKACEFRCVRNANADSSYHSGPPRHRGARRVAVADSRARRRMRQRTDDRCCASCASASAARRCSTSTSSARRRRRSASCARSTAVVAVPGQRSVGAGRAGARAAFDATLAFFARARDAGERAGDVPPRRVPRAADVRELPGLRRVLHDCIDGLAASGNRFVLTSRYVARTLRLLRDRSARFEVIHMPALTAEDTQRHPRPTARRRRRQRRARRRLSRAHGAGARRRPADLRPRARRRARRAARARRPRQRRRDQRAGGAARAPRAVSPGSASFCYELRLHRARGYGALKAILEILARGRRADAHRDLAAAAAHARVDEGLSVVARGRRPRDVAAEALQLHRSAAARLGAPALPRRRRRPKTISRAKCTATRCRACRSRPSRRRRRTASRRSRWPADRRRGSSRSTSQTFRVGELVSW